MDGVGEFMDDDGFCDVRVEENESPVEVEVFGARAAAPAGFLATHGDVVEGYVHFFPQGCGSLGEEFFGDFAEVFFEDFFGVGERAVALDVEFVAGDGGDVLIVRKLLDSFDVRFLLWCGQDFDGVRQTQNGDG